MHRPAISRPSSRPPRRGRRGGALLLVLFVTVALGAIAASAVALTRTTSLVSAYYERERDYRYAAEAGLAIGRSRVQRDTTLALPDSGFVTIARTPVLDANGVRVPRAGVTLYIGKSGITTGQYGQFVTVVARADDGSNTRYVRRLELAAENFARFAMFTNTWASNLYYGNGEFIRGLAWSNQTWASYGSPTYSDTVGAVGAITASGASGPTYVKGPGSVKPYQAPIPMPTISRLAFMPGYAAGANLSFTPAAGTTLRLEFVAADLDASGDSTGVNEGFVRAFQSNAGNAPSGYAWKDRLVLPSWGLNTPPAWVDSMCGDFHGGKFYPAVVHKQQWFKDDLASRGIASTFEVGISTVPDSNAVAPISQPEHDLVMRNATARCYPAGAPQLVAVDRQPGVDNGSGSPWPVKSQQVGGDETTFTPYGRWGKWLTWPISPTAAVLNGPRVTQAKWLFPLNKTNPGWRGIVYVNGDAYVSGLLRSRVTLYSSGALTFLDDLVYVTPPNTPGGACEADNSNILGMIAANDIMIEDNALHRPVRILYTKPSDPSFGVDSVRFMSGTGPNFRLNGVLMSLTGTVGVKNPLTGPSVTAGNCMGRATSGGCISQIGGVIEQTISATWTGNATGFAENREVDRCMLVTSPPYFPTTGRYLLNRYYESDPSRFDPASLFRSLQAY